MNFGQVSADRNKDEDEARRDFISSHHVERRVQLYVPKEDTFPIPLKYMTRPAHTIVDVLQERASTSTCQ